MLPVRIHRRREGAGEYPPSGASGTAGADDEDAPANPEKSGGAKLRDWDETRQPVRDVMFAGLQLAKPGKPGDAKVGPAPQETAEW